MLVFNVFRGVLPQLNQPYFLSPSDRYICREFSVGKTITGALDCIQIFCLINKPSKSRCIGFPALDFSGDIVQNILCPLSCMLYCSILDLYVCVDLQCAYFAIF